MVIGSTVAMLWTHKILILSGEIDVAHVDDDAFFSACERVRKALALPIPVQRVGTFDAPYTFEDRLEPLGQVAPFKKLQLVLPERHDWALMKTARGYEHDLALIDQVHGQLPFDLKTLIDRYREMKFVGNPRTLRLNFLALIERLFGEAAARETERELGEG